MGVLVIANIWSCKTRVLAWLIGLIVLLLAHWALLYQPGLAGYTVSVSDSRSNYPTIQPGDVVLSRTQPTYQRGAFVGYEVTVSRVDRKRILGVPGDTIEVCGTQVVVNGYRVQFENGGVLLDLHSSCDRGATKFELQDDEYFLVGDSSDSLDSRHLGPVSEEAIRYHAVLLVREDEVVSLKPDGNFSALER